MTWSALLRRSRLAIGASFVAAGLLTALLARALATTPGVFILVLLITLAPALGLLTALLGIALAALIVSAVLASTATLLATL